jgi:hypothetical protein
MVKIETSSLRYNLRMLWKEKFIQKIKEDRTECFIDDHFQCRSEVAIDSMLPIGSKCLFCI